jgi:hypothetical protein
MVTGGWVTQAVRELAASWPPCWTRPATSPAASAAWPRPPSVRDVLTAWRQSPALDDIAETVSGGGAVAWLRGRLGCRRSSRPARRSPSESGVSGRERPATRGGRAAGGHVDDARVRRERLELAHSCRVG